MEAIQWPKFKETVCQLWQDIQGTDKGWNQALVKDYCKDPVLATYGCCCKPCLWSQVSANKGNNALGSCLCGCFCPCCHICAFRASERMDTNGQDDILISYAREGCCEGWNCGAVQHAAQLQLKPGMPSRPGEPAQQQM